jgi:hypothetical protein
MGTGYPGLEALGIHTQYQETVLLWLMDYQIQWRAELIISSSMNQT